MSSLSLHDLQGISAHSNKIRVPSGNSLQVEGTFKMPNWTTAGRPSSPEVGMIGWNTSKEEVEVYDGTGWVRAGLQGILDGSTAQQAAPGPSYLYNTAGITTDGVYWLRPDPSVAPYQCYCEFNLAGNHWAVVAGMSASGVRADVSGNDSGMAGFSRVGENTQYCTLSATNNQNNSGLNFTLPEAWVDATLPIGLKVRSSSQHIFALFNRSGSYVPRGNIWAYYWAANQYDDIPAANGNRFTSATIESWVQTHVDIYKTVTNPADTGPLQGKLWSGNHHCGWSTITSPHYHMLHGSTNFAYSSSPYPGYCLNGTCWNESGILSLSW